MPEYRVTVEFWIRGQAELAASGPDKDAVSAKALEVIGQAGALHHKHFHVGTLGKVRDAKVIHVREPKYSDRDPPPYEDPN